MRVTKQRTYGNKLTYRALTMNDLVDWIAGSPSEQPIQTFRERLRYAYPNKSYTFTRKIPKVLFAGTFRTGKLREYNGWVLLEVDQLSGEEEAVRLREKVSRYPQTLFAMVGSSGRSVKFVVPYTRPDGSLPRSRGEAELFHAHAYRHALKTYEPRLSYPISLRRPVLERACRLSHDAEVYYNPDALVIHLEQPTEMPEESFHQERYEKLVPEENMARSTRYEQYRFRSIQYELALRQVLEEREVTDETPDYKPLLANLGQLCVMAGIAEEECVRWTMLYFARLLSEVEIRETLRNAYLSTKEFGTRELYNPEQLQALKMEEFMARRYDFHLNVMTGAPEYREKNTFCFDFRPITERVLNSIALNAQKEGLSLWDRDVRRYVYSDRVRDFNPIEDYLSHLPTWDGKDRIRPLAARVPCDNPRWEQLFYTWFLSMVAHWQGRDRRHGNSVSPLLVGGQGCGKSTFCLNLLPPELNGYYTDSIDFNRKRDAELYLTRFGLINIDEFDQVSESHQGFLKHLLQKPVVNLRKPYAGQVEAVRRYASFIATSNHSDLLSDPSGSRRFICVEVKGMIENTQPVDYEQVYAQAIAALDKGERYWLTYDEEQEQRCANEVFRQRPLSEDLFYRFYRPAEHRDEGVRMSAGEIYLSLRRKSGIPLPTGKISHFGRFLKNEDLISFQTSRGRLYLVVEKED